MTHSTETSSVLISVIVPFYGNKNNLLKCLNALQNQNFNYPCEIVVVVSGSNKIHLDIKHYIKIIYFPERKYPGEARNIGVSNSSAGLLAFTDADCVPDPEWLKEVHNSLVAGNEIVIGPVINFHPFHPIASVDNLLQFPDFQIENNQKNISHFPGCNFGITRNLFCKTSGFREDIITGEDVIFSQSALKESAEKIFFNKKSVVKHIGRKHFFQFLNHNETLGFQRGFLKLKITQHPKNNFYNFLFSLLFGFRRLAYISLRTLQWNPTGFFRIIIYFPFVLIGLAAWVKGFYLGNKNFIEAGK